MPDFFTMFQDAFGNARRVPPASQEDVDALAARTAQAATKGDVDAVREAMPKPANVDPQPERMTAARGGDVSRYALEDHRHPRLTSSKNVTLDANGLATVTFDRVFEVEPTFLAGPIGSFGNTPPIVGVEGWVKDVDGKFIGANLKGVRAVNQVMASTTPPLLNISILSGGQTVQPFNAPAANVKVSATFLQPSS